MSTPNGRKIPVTIEEAQALNRALQIDVMNIIRAFEDLTGLRVTKARMEHFEDARYFNTSVYMPPKTKPKD